MTFLVMLCATHTIRERHDELSQSVEFVKLDCAIV